MRRWWMRLALSMGIACLLPFPGPHVDYVPLIGTLREGMESADKGFFVILAIAFFVYSAVAFGVLSAIFFVRNRKSRSIKVGEES